MPDSHILVVPHKLSCDWGRFYFDLIYRRVIIKEKWHNIGGIGVHSAKFFGSSKVVSKSHFSGRK